MISAPAARREPCVAIDGPAGAGKSTVSRRVAAELGYLLLDTGALYRGVALAAREAGAPWDDENAVGAVADDLVAADGLRFETGDGVAPRLVLHGRDVSSEIRTAELGQGASRVSALPRVRDALLDLQRREARVGGVVLEGRDIGTVVLPDAEAKFFLTASVEIRAERRRDELATRGDAPSLEDVIREIRERDTRDTTRAVAPLKPAHDALLVDSSEMTIDEVVATITAHVRRIRDAMRGEP